MKSFPRTDLIGKPLVAFEALPALHGAPLDLGFGPLRIPRPRARYGGRGLVAGRSSARAIPPTMETQGERVEPATRAADSTAARPS